MWAYSCLSVFCKCVRYACIPMREHFVGWCLGFCVLMCVCVFCVRIHVCMFMYISATGRSVESFVCLLKRNLRGPPTSMGFCGTKPYLFVKKKKQKQFV